MSVSPGVVERPLLVGGERVETGAWHEVRSPYDGALVSRVAWAGPDVAVRAVEEAVRAQRKAPMATVARSDVLRRASDALRERRDELAAIVCAEAGKPITTALAEVERAAATLAIASEEARRVAGSVIPLPDSDVGERKLAFTVRRPIGVVAAITPFNFPLNLVVHKVGPALAAGCPVVLKPADKAPGAAFALAEILTDAGLPGGWLNVVLGPAPDVVGALVDHPGVRLVTFTGSASVGEALARRAGAKRVALELGNATPVIVEPDADVALAARRTATSAFAFSGQTCISAQRAYVQERVYPRFLAELAGCVRALRAGDPADPATTVGPLITREAADRLAGRIADAVAGGAQIVTGGQLDGAVLAPTVLADVDPGSSLVREEAFGPILVVASYERFEDALAAANATDYGLQAAVFTSTMARVTEAIAALEFGAVIVNDSPSFRQDHMPYGGVKASGNTREGPARAILEMTEEQLVVLDA